MPVLFMFTENYLSQSSFICHIVLVDRGYTSDSFPILVAHFALDPVSEPLNVSIFMHSATCIKEKIKTYNRVSELQGRRFTSELLSFLMKYKWSPK